MKTRGDAARVAGVVAIIGAGILGGIGGCGTGLLTIEDNSGDGPTENPVRTISPKCERAPDVADANTLVVLDWTGGSSRQTPGGSAAAFDFDALTFTDAQPGDSVTEDDFRAAVLARVQAILCNLDPMDVAVIVGESDRYPDATIVHISGDAPPNDGNQIGQSEFDACNEYGDDAALVWGGLLAERIGMARFDQWVNAFANTIGHEIGHTLGFFHPNPETLERSLPIPENEIMRKSTNVAELLTEKEFLVEQDTCPGGEGSYHLLDAAQADLSPTALQRKLSAPTEPAGSIPSPDDQVVCGVDD